MTMSILFLWGRELIYCYAWFF